MTVQVPDHDSAKFLVILTIPSKEKKIQRNGCKILLNVRATFQCYIADNATLVTLNP